MDKQQIGIKIRTIREERDILQEGLGQYIGVTNKCVQSWEAGRTLPDVITLHKIADFFAVDINYFFNQDGESLDKETYTCELTKRELDILNKIRTSSPKKRYALEIFLEIEK